MSSRPFVIPDESITAALKSPGGCDIDLAIPASNHQDFGMTIVGSPVEVLAVSPPCA